MSDDDWGGLNDLTGLTADVEEPSTGTSTPAPVMPRPAQNKWAGEDEEEVSLCGEGRRGWRGGSERRQRERERERERGRWGRGG